MECPDTLLQDLRETVAGIFYRQKLEDQFRNQAMLTVNQLVKDRFLLCPESFRSKVSDDNIFLGLHYIRSQFNIRNEKYFRINGRFVCPMGCLVMTKNKTVIDQHFRENHSE